MTFDPINNADSQFQRQTSKKKVKGKDQGQLDGEMIRQMLGIEDEQQPGIADKSPLKMMDIVYDVWGVPDEVDTGDEEEFSEEEDEGMDQGLL
jgi:hypothetical protein